MLPERSDFTLAGSPVAPDAPPRVVAEIGLNHGGDPARAEALVRAAAESGADAVKLQTLTAAALVSSQCPAPAHVRASSLVDFFARFELDEAVHAALVAEARACGLAVMATPLSMAAVDLLERVGVDALKIASGDLTWGQLIARCAETGRPVVISTGMATLDEVAHAVDVARRHGSGGLALLHCVSAYPVPAGQENLRAIATLARRFGLPVGLSDHSRDAGHWPAAVALGASLYERHLTLPHDDEAVDRDVSSTPGELAAAIEAGRRTWAALGTGEKVCLPAEAGNRSASRRSLHAARPLVAGAVLGPDDVVVVRPDSGLPPSRLSDVIGCRLARAVPAGHPLRAEHLDSSVAEESHVA